MISYIIRRLLLLLPTAFLALSFLFLLFFVLPGDPATLIAGGANRNVDPEVVEHVAERYGLDDSLFVAVLALLGADVPLGPRQSFVNNRSVNDILGEKAPRSLRLGLLGDHHRDRRRHLGRADLVGQALLRSPTRSRRSSPPPRRRIPVFVLGFVLQYTFAVYPNKHDWPEWARLRTSRHRARQLVPLRHPDR